jgi:hypothetical protein
MDIKDSNPNWLFSFPIWSPFFFSFLDKYREKSISLLLFVVVLHTLPDICRIFLSSFPHYSASRYWEKKQEIQDREKRKENDKLTFI